MAEDGLVGMDLFKKALLSGQPFQLVCLDISMHNMDGRDVLRTIRNLEENQGVCAAEEVKVLMITGNDDRASILESFKAKCDGYLPKPLAKKSFMAKLAEIKVLEPKVEEEGGIRLNTLVIEDEKTTRLILGKWMSSFGTCDVASDGHEGVDAFRLALKSGAPYDLICLDIIPGMNGHQALQEIRALEASMGVVGKEGVKVLMVTANEDGASVMKAFKAQCSGYMTKPLSRAKLVEQLKEMDFTVPE